MHGADSSHTDGTHEDRPREDRRREDVDSDVFRDTIAEMTWQEVERAADDGAVLLWAFGVIEQHGPHLPAGTDVYLPSAQLRGVRRELARRGVPALIMPPYYWGVNVVSGSFPASYNVRPEVMKALMADVLTGIGKDGFRHVFCFSGHGDALNNRTVHEGIRLGSQLTGLDISFVIDRRLAERLGLDPDDPHVSPTGAALAKSDTSATPAHIDVHAGDWETSQMLVAQPSLVRNDVRAGLKSTEYGPEDLAVWRKGYGHARVKTPLGYFGDPAAADAANGRRLLEQQVTNAADAIQERLRLMGRA